MGSDGEFIEHKGLTFQSFSLPPGTGSGCVKTGPFSNMTVHLGPFFLPDYGAPTTTTREDPLKDNPRCLKRDLNGYPAAKWASLRNTTELILTSPNIEIFQGVAQGLKDYYPVDPGMGVHGGGHYTIGGDPGGDVYLSPGEPVFYLHHAQLDRAYWIWQNLDWENRQVRATRVVPLKRELYCKLILETEHFWDGNHGEQAPEPRGSTGRLAGPHAHQ
jgi:tyrosinase